MEPQSQKSEHDLDQDGCLHRLFEAQVDLRPDAPAILYGSRRISYAELDAEANRLARYILAQGGGPGKFAGIYFDRSVRPIVALLACLKSGTAYLPIDPGYPADRIRHILSESGAVLLLTEKRYRAPSGELFSGVIFDLESDLAALAAYSPDRLSDSECGVRPADLAYVIYTSGTTGRPKGVMAEHRHVTRFARAFNTVCGTGPRDRVYQGFSLSFDGSVEEIWMAFSNGSALVVGDALTPRFGAELGHFLNDQGVTYFSTVPTLLATIPEAIPSLRLLVVSGEICAADMVNRWTTPHLRMLNVYGPTEGTVNTTAFECRPGKPVTIGKPLPGYLIHIVDAEMRPVARGEKGELYVGGETIARGYLRQPELSAERFLTIPFPGVGTGADPLTRFYRTGDLVRWNEDGDLEFFGRIDSQVKIRGFRVELAEIEAILLENPKVRSATVKLVEKDGLQELAAYLVLHAGAGELDRADLLGRLENRVPHYMIPGFLDVLDEFPMLTSGKADRSRLPPPMRPFLRLSKVRVAPATELETVIAGVWERVFGIPEVSVESDFFLDLGGHSLVAARMVTMLREATNRRVTVRDAYQHATIRKLAAHLATLSVRTAEIAAPTAEEVFASVPRAVRLTTAALQALSIYFFGLLFAIPLAIIFKLGLRWYGGELSILTLLSDSTAIGAMMWPILLAVSVIAKWLVIGRYRAGKYPLWGFYYFRWWFVSRLQALSGAGALTGTPLLAVYFRLLGAKIGRGVTLDTGHLSITDLATIGDESSLGADTQLLGYRVENGNLIVGSTTIGDRCFVGIHSVLGLNVKMENDSSLDDQSLLPDGRTLAHGETYRGSPAQSASMTLPGLNTTQGRHRRPVLFGAIQYLLMTALGVVVSLPALGVVAGLAATYRSYGTAICALVLLLSVPVSFTAYCFLIVALKRMVLFRASPGVYRLDSAFYLRKWLSDRIMALSRAVLLPIYTTLYLPPWLRLMGAKIGRHAELSSIWAFSPELVEIGPESFFADGSIIGGKRIHRGHFELGINRIGRRSFVGNSAILPVGRGLGDGCLLGVQSIPPPGCGETPDGTEWLGSPPFALPNRLKVGNFGDALTFQPTRKLYLQRAVVDGLRVVIPGYILLTSAAIAVVVFKAVLAHGTGWLMAAAPLVLIAVGIFESFIVVALKWGVMGTFKPEIKPLWSMYVWLNEMVNGIYESIMAPVLAPYLGTPFVAPLLRLLGCKIGRRTFLETTLFSEFDLVRVGDYAALNSGAVIQNHLFEDRVMKSSSLTIGKGCSVGNLGVVLYDSEMEANASLGPLSLLMKGETLGARVRAHGIPCVPMGGGALETPLTKEPLEFHGLVFTGASAGPVRKKVQPREAVS